VCGLRSKPSTLNTLAPAADIGTVCAFIEGELNPKPLARESKSESERVKESESESERVRE